VVGSGGLRLLAPRKRWRGRFPCIPCVPTLTTAWLKHIPPLVLSVSKYGFIEAIFCLASAARQARRCRKLLLHRLLYRLARVLSVARANVVARAKVGNAVSVVRVRKETVQHDRRESVRRDHKGNAHHALKVQSVQHDRRESVRHDHKGNAHHALLHEHPKVK
jgi:hypothetical protein